MTLPSICLNNRLSAVLISVVAVGLAVVSVGLPTDLVVLGLGFAVTISAICVRWPLGAALALFVAAVIPGCSVKIAGLTVRPEQIVVLAIIPVVGGRVRNWNLPDTLLAGFLAANVLSSAVVSPVRTFSLRHALLLTFSVLSYWIVRKIAADDGVSFRLFLLAGVGAAVMGIGCYLLHSLVGTDIGIMYYPATLARDELAGVKGANIEANIFGSYAGSLSSVLFAMYLQQSRRDLLCGWLLASIATALSLARAAWLGLGVALGLATLCHASARQRKLALIGALLIVVCMPIFMLVPTVHERIASLTPATVLEDPTLLHRAYYAGLALDNIRIRPWLGWGTDSFELMQDWDTENGMQGAWVGNMTVRVLHDTGVIGTVMLLGFFGITMWRAWRSRDSMAKALCFGALILLIAFQFTDATTLAYPWLLFGLMTAATQRAVDRSRIS